MRLLFRTHLHSFSWQYPVGKVCTLGVNLKDSYLVNDQIWTPLHTAIKVNIHHPIIDRIKQILENEFR